MARYIAIYSELRVAHSYPQKVCPENYFLAMFCSYHTLMVHTIRVAICTHIWHIATIRVYTHI